MENDPFEDIFPIENGGKCPLLLPECTQTFENRITSKNPASSSCDLLITQMEVTKISPEKVTNKTLKRVTGKKLVIRRLQSYFLPGIKSPSKSALIQSHVCTVTRKTKAMDPTPNRHFTLGEHWRWMTHEMLKWWFTYTRCFHGISKWMKWLNLYSDLCNTPNIN